MNQIDVLNKGSVQLIDFSGDDETLVKIARNSYDNFDKDSTPEDNFKLLDYLIREEHTSPIEFSDFIFKIKAPIFVARQTIRHRTASLNEISGRYLKLHRDFYIPHEMRIQSKSSKQSSYGVHENSAAFISQIEKLGNACFDNYEAMIEMGAAKEQARTILPVGTYTSWFWKMDLHNLLHFLRLRLHPHAQYEIRVYAEAMLSMIEEVVPQTVSVWKNRILNSIRFSQHEVDFLKDIIDLDLLPKDWSDRDIRIFKNKIK